MAEELKPCPFCGGNAFAVAHSRVNALGVTDYSGNVMCCKCQVSAGSDGFMETEDEAITSAMKKWNTRAERTTRLIWNKNNDCFECENCGKGMKPEWVHCPRYGAEVVRR